MAQNALQAHSERVLFVALYSIHSLTSLFNRGYPVIMIY